jgi:hypothetical protein
MSLQDRYCGDLCVNSSCIAGTFDIAGNHCGDPVSDYPQCQVWHFGQFWGAGPHNVVKILLNTYFLHCGEPGSPNLSHIGFLSYPALRGPLLFALSNLGALFTWCPSPQKRCLGLPVYQVLRCSVPAHKIAFFMPTLSP